MRNREMLEERTGIKSEKSDLELAKSLAEKWHGKCGYKMCPAYDGFLDGRDSDVCSVDIDKESTETCAEAIFKWLTADFIPVEVTKLNNI